MIEYKHDYKIIFVIFFCKNHLLNKNKGYYQFEHNYKVNLGNHDWKKRLQMKITVTIDYNYDQKIHFIIVFFVKNAYKNQQHLIFISYKHSSMYKLKFELLA